MTGGNGYDKAPPLWLSEWLERDDLAEPDFLLGNLLSTTTRLLIVGPTGLGKTMFGLAVAIAIASNKGFLKWCARRVGRVLYIDGEMSRRELRRRLRDAVRREGAGDYLAILSKEDHPGLPPLNTKEGQKWLDAFIKNNGPFDLVIFDNIQALLVGDMKDEEQWSSLLPWVRDLTRRCIGQVWFHHTGHDESRSYGSKAREWQMDTVALMERVELPGTDLAFSLKFTKARERTSASRSDFEPVTMALTGDEWSCDRTPPPKKELGINQRVMFAILADAMPTGLDQDEWHEKAREAGIKTRQRLFEVKRDLKARQLVHEYGGKWFVTASGPRDRHEVTPL